MKRLSLLVIAPLLAGCVAGPMGPQGPQGIPGLQGRPGDPAPTLDANLVAAQVLAMLPTPEPQAAAEWENWSTRFELYTDDNPAPISLGTGGSLTVKGYAMPHAVTVEAVVQFGTGPTFPGAGAIVLWPKDPAIRETVIVQDNQVKSLSAVGICLVYRASKGTKLVGLANMEQLPGDPFLPENKGLTCYLPRNDAGAYTSGAYRVKAAGAPWGTAWAPGDTITWQIQWETP